ncbi:MAG: site-specific DNA-methyltransferase [Alphaproteobacteria bacterium]|nr:site-specific DNA-methyltransferase [Alphaproteobacteria bacterium]
MEKLKMHTHDLTQDHIARIREMFPNCVTEAKDAQGAIKLAVDFDLLKQELSGQIVEGPQERYHLNWPGKREALLTANAPIAKTLRPARDESVNFDTTKNLFIEGDNLEALKLLQETYLGKIKMIYIDPPYNTGNDFIYEDDFAEDVETFKVRSNQKTSDGIPLVANSETNGRFHSDWLSFIYPRLRLARNLLSDDGVVFISIGEHEIDNLLKLCKEVFGEENFVTTFIRQRKKKPSFLHSNVGSMFEYVVCVAKNRAFAPPFSVDVTTAGKKYPLNNAGNSIGVLTFPSRSVRFSEKLASYEPQDMSEGNIITRLLDKVDVLDNLNVDAFRLEGEFRYSQTYLDEIIRAGEAITISKAPFRPNHIKAGGDVKKMHNLLSPETYQSGTNEDGTSELESLFGAVLFDNPKPSSLIHVLCKAVTYDAPDAIVVDFFAGSSTTAHAVLRLNAEDGGNRTFIMIQLPEECDPKSEAYKAGYKTIAEISKERIRRAGKKIQEDNPLFNGDVGFRVLKIATSNMDDAFYKRVPDDWNQDNLLVAATGYVKTDRTPEDLLFQVIVDWGSAHLLTAPIERETLLNKQVYFVDSNALAACFDTDISEDFVKELAARKPLRVVFRDNGFANDAVKINVDQIFKQISPVTEVKVI